MDIVRQELSELLNAQQFNIQEKKLYIWGTGNTALLYNAGLQRLEKEGIVIEGYCDNAPSKWGGVCNGKRIVSPNQLQAIGNAFVLICSPQLQVVAAVSSQLERMNISYAHIDAWIFTTHREQVLAVYDMLGDDESRIVYKEIIQCRMKGENPKAELVCGRQYHVIPEFSKRNPKEVFVDCGAFVGDTIERYIWKRDGVFAKIIGFEPDPCNYEAMEERISRLRKEWNIPEKTISVYAYGVGEKNASGVLERYADNNGLSSKVGLTDPSEAGNGKTGDIAQCQVISLDGFIREEVSFIKADIEGYEYGMLMGARDTINRYKPRLAICIYHNGVDIYSIPLLIKRIVPEYKMAVRQHSYETDETVLYAWIEEK